MRVTIIITPAASAAGEQEERQKALQRFPRQRA
jgi:hypothetical protein